MFLLRKLLLDAQRRFRNMVEENVKLAAKIDASIHIAKEEVNSLRVELADASRKLGELYTGNTNNQSQRSLYHLPRRHTSPARVTSSSGSKMAAATNGNVPEQTTGARDGGDSGSRETENSANNNRTEDEVEIQHLRQRNRQLQSQLNTLKQQLYEATQQQQQQQLQQQQQQNNTCDRCKQQSCDTCARYGHFCDACSASPSTAGERSNGGGDGGGGYTAASQRELNVQSKLQNATDESKVNELKMDLLQTHQELNRTKDALQAMKAERKHLKAEKVELLNQLKQLYCTLEDKESELREFIRTYEQRMKETEANIKQYAIEKEECEHEKWEILKRARDASERSVALRAELDLKDQHIKRLDTMLAQARDKLAALGQNPSTCPSREQLNSSNEDMLITSSYRPIPPPPDPPRMYRSDDSAYASYAHTQSNGSLCNMQGLNDTSRSSDELQETMFSAVSAPSSANPLSSAPPPPPPTRAYRTPPPPASSSTSAHHSRSQPHHHHPPSSSSAAPSTSSGGSNSYSVTKKKRKSLGTLTRMFGKSRSRRSIAVSDPSILEEHVGECPSPRLSVLTPENYQEKLGLLQQAGEMRMEHWKASYVLAWIEIELNMPAYGKNCAKNIKSGKVLMSLNDTELDNALKLTSPLHRRKIRLAIEEKRTPELCAYPRCSSLDHTWVSHVWVKDLGLPQYSSVFEQHLIDGRLLHALTKKDMERYLGVTRKFHYASIVHGIELLRIIQFDKEVLQSRRQKCENNDGDPLVWTNQRLRKWVKEIDLEEYAPNLAESGVHGAVLVLETTFNATAMAAALGIPEDRTYVRRHLAAEMDAIIKPARAALEFATHVSKKKLPKSSSSAGSLGRAFLRSYRGGGGSVGSEVPTGGGGEGSGELGAARSKAPGSSSSGKKLNFRGSLGRALGRRAKLEVDTFTPPNYSSRPTPPRHLHKHGGAISISNPIPIRKETEAQGTTV